MALNGNSYQYPANLFLSQTTLVRLPAIINLSQEKGHLSLFDNIMFHEGTETSFGVHTPSQQLLGFFNKS